MAAIKHPLDVASPRQLEFLFLFWRQPIKPDCAVDTRLECRFVPITDFVVPDHTAGSPQTKSGAANHDLTFEPHIPGVIRPLEVLRNDELTQRDWLQQAWRRASERFENELCSWCHATFARTDGGCVVEDKSVPLQGFFSRGSLDINGHPSAHDAPLGVVKDRPDLRCWNPRCLKEHESDVGRVTKFPGRTRLPQEHFREPGALVVVHAKVGLKRLDRPSDRCPMAHCIPLEKCLFPSGHLVAVERTGKRLAKQRIVAEELLSRPRIQINHL